MLPIQEITINGSINMIGYALATLGPALGVAWIFASVINGTARQPEARGAMMGTAWIGFAVVEALAIIGIALAFVL
ncbi:MAG: ATP synthase F0 subunit C [Propionicimonas sp.]